MNEEDKRVIRTRAKLAKALIELSKELGYDEITIQNIADRAGINHRTFYRHYDGKDDLLRDVLKTTADDLRQVLPPPTHDELADGNYDEIARRMGRTFYEYVTQNSDVFRLLLQSGPDYLLPIQSVAKAQTEAYFASLPLDNIPAELVAHHMIVSTFSLVQWWLNNDMPCTPEQMGDYNARLVMVPIHRLWIGNR